jgi:hypothetical protein
MVIQLFPNDAPETSAARVSLLDEDLSQYRCGSQNLLNTKKGKNAMSDSQYKKFYGNPAIEVRDISSTIGAKISGFLTSDVHVASLKFPPLRRTNVGNKRYLPSDYLAVGLNIGRNKVEVYETREDYKWHAMYFNSSQADAILLTPKVTACLTKFLDVIVHEATHMVQDYKRERISMLEQEVDGKFAQALYLLRSGRSLSALPIDLAIAAELFDEDPDYLESNHFRWKKLPTIESSLIAEYSKVVKNKNGTFDAKEFQRAKRLDGIAL